MIHEGIWPAVVRASDSRAEAFGTPGPRPTLPAFNEQATAYFRTLVGAVVVVNNAG